MANADDQSKPMLVPVPRGEPQGVHAVLFRRLMREALQRDVPDLEAWVEEGPHRYPIEHELAGWGAVMSRISTATVSVYRVESASTRRTLLGQAEVRVNNGRPSTNAEQFVRAAIALLRQGVYDRPGAPAQTPELAPPSPTGLARVVQFGRRVRSSIKARLRREASQWAIGVLRASAVAYDKPFPWGAVIWVVPPDDQFIADPFLVEREGELWLFYERLLHAENKGTLWAARLDPTNGALSDAREILRTPFHLSFPNVFESDGQWYMLPEQARSGKTTLYRAVEFPYRWEPWRDLLPTFPGIDPVLHRHAGRWWLFVSHGAHPCTENNLYLFSSESLSGEFVAHPANPVKSGLRGARMAGPIQVHDARMIRPGQDGRLGYGSGTVLHEIHTLDAQTYAETELCLWPPEPKGRFGLGFHSYMVCGDWLVIDGRRVIPQR